MVIGRTEVRCTHPLRRGVSPKSKSLRLETAARLRAAFWIKDIEEKRMGNKNSGRWPRPTSIAFNAA